MRTAEGKGDLAVIASPIQFHCPQTCGALEMGMSEHGTVTYGGTLGDALTGTRDDGMQRKLLDHSPALPTLSPIPP